MRLLAKMSFKRALAMNTKGFAGKNSFHGIIHSDTLFSGIVNQWAKIPALIDIDDLLESFKSGEPPFLISSAFPCAGVEYYLPTPRGDSKIFLEILKEVPYVGLSSFIKIARGDADHLWQSPPENKLTQFITAFTSPRVAIDRLTYASNVYDLTGCTFARGSGLYFLIQLNNEELRNDLELCIRLLGQSGIGSDKSVGMGTCDFEITDISGDPEFNELFLKKNEGALSSYCSLSLCCPRDNGEAAQAMAYDLITRSGWISSSSSPVQTRRRECRMFSEGSLFKKPVKGRLVDVTPSDFKDHRVYRYGIAMMVTGVW